MKIVIYKKSYIIIILLILIFYLTLPILKDKLMILKINKYRKLFPNNKIIAVDISEIGYNSGPGTYIKGINQILPFNWGNCSFISSYLHINKDFQPDIYFFPFPSFNENQYMKFIKTKLINKFILGPIFVPKEWNSFPNDNIWIEQNFPYLLELSKGIAVHSTRVRDYLAKRADIGENKLNKFKILRSCTNLKPTKIKSFKERKIDILFFEKYADYNKRIQGQKLLNLLRTTSKIIKTIKYGSYKKKMMKQLANNSKFIIYFSFYDTGAIGLKEFQNYGVITFSHQKEFIIDNKTSFYVPELDNDDKIELAFNKIINIVENISKSNVNTELIAKKNQLINQCENALIDLCKSLF